MKNTTGTFALTMLTFAAAAFAPACGSATGSSTSGSTKEVVEATSSAITVSDRMVVGSLDYGQTSAPVAYTNNPRYRAFKFAGAAGDAIDVWVRSQDGDAVAWVLDNDFKSLGYNDDADSTTTDAHVSVTLPANASQTHYIVFREFDQQKATFTVSLKGPSKLLSCNVDADCVTVPKACCTNLGNTAVAKGQEQAYRDSLDCPAHLLCPMVMLKNDHGVAECNNTTHSCEYVLPKDIACQGFVRNSHQCPAGFRCELPVRGGGDIPGTCAQQCGGIAGFQCDDPNAVCVDDPSDSCDPAHGGADCMGICQPKPACVQKMMCMQNAHFDTTTCGCVPN